LENLYLEKNNFILLLMIAGGVGDALSPEPQPVDVMKLFSSSLTLRTNQLESFSTGKPFKASLMLMGKQGANHREEHLQGAPLG
jgi:hypothetical protein